MYVLCHQTVAIGCGYICQKTELLLQLQRYCLKSDEYLNSQSEKLRHQENSFCVEGLVCLMHLTGVMNFSVRNIFSPFFRHKF